MLGVKLRERTTETVVLNVAAIRTAGRLDEWQAPRLEPLDVVGSVTVLGLLVEDRLKAESLAAEGLIPIDVSVFGDVLTPIISETSAGIMPLRRVAAWYAPQSRLSALRQLQKAAGRNGRHHQPALVLSDKGQEVFGGLAFLPQVERRFSFDVAVPAGWQINSVTAADGKPLPYRDLYRLASGWQFNCYPNREKGRGDRKSPLSQWERGRG